jgi:hypothetical protein
MWSDRSNHELISTQASAFLVKDDFDRFFGYLTAKDGVD